MAKTLANVRTHVRSLLDEASAADWTDLELNKLINNRYHRVISAVVNVYEDFYITTALWNSVANQEEYGSSDGVPTDIYKIRRLELNYDVSSSSNAPVICTNVPMDAIMRDLAYTNAGVGTRITSGTAYYTYGFGSSIKIGFITKPDKTGTNAVKIWYIPEAADLSSDSSNVNIPYADRYWQLITDGSTGDALRFGQQGDEIADKYDIKFESGLAVMQQELEDRIAHGVKQILDVQGDNLDMMSF
jgi:hypothetical protein